MAVRQIRDPVFAAHYWYIASWLHTHQLGAAFGAADSKTACRFLDPWEGKKKKFMGLFHGFRLVAICCSISGRLVNLSVADKKKKQIREGGGGCVDSLSAGHTQRVFSQTQHLVQK